MYTVMCTQVRRTTSQTRVSSLHHRPQRDVSSVYQTVVLNSAPSEDHVPNTFANRKRPGPTAREASSTRPFMLQFTTNCTSVEQPCTLSKSRSRRKTTVRA